MKSLFFKRTDRKGRLIKIHIEQNNDHTRIEHKVRFCSSFKTSQFQYIKIIQSKDWP